MIMSKSNGDNVKSLFGGKIRIRVIGVLIKDEKILMVKHRNIGPDNVLWIPPGGGVDVGETLQDALQREFKEETGIEIEIEQFMFIYEFIEDPLHAVEIFFKVRQTGGELITGKDPEMKDFQIIDHVNFLTFREVNQINSLKLHGIFEKCKSLNEFLNLKGYFKSSK